MPLSPLVIDTQRKASPHTTMPSASVIIRKYVPVARIASRPKTAAVSAASATPRHQARQEAALVLGGEDADRVGRDAEVGGVAERRQAGVAEQHVEAHGQDGDDRRLRQQRQG